MLIIISPIMILISILLYARHGEVVFRQVRPGYKGRPFTILKFATLNTKEEADSSIRKFIRKSHLNELPQLINILEGKMSWIGPRPLLSEYMPYYSIEQNARHDVKPGIFGLAQLRESEIKSWNEKFELDLEYVKNQSFILDFKIFSNSMKYALSGKLFDRAHILNRFNSE